MLALRGAQPAEIEESLNFLWPLMRHVTREACWLHIEADEKENPRLRAEIREFFSAREAESEQARPIVEEAVAHPEKMMDGLRGIFEYVEEWSRFWNHVTECHAALHEGKDPLLAWLPQPEFSGRHFWFDAEQANERFDEVFEVLAGLTHEIEPEVGGTVAYLAVLGPVHDRLRWDDPEGFGEPIQAAREEFLRRRCGEDRADLFDHWLLVTTYGERATRREDLEWFADHLRVAEMAELRAFFEAMDSEVYPEVLPEREFSGLDLERLWRQIIGREDATREVLGRAGFYYWHTSEHHNGPWKTLSALGLCGGADSRWEVLPFSAFWAAARDAAAMGKWDIARDCLNRALLGLAMFAPAVNRGGWLTSGERFRDQVERFHWDARFIEEIDRRFSDGSLERSPQFFLYLALQGLANAKVDEMLPARLVLERLGQRLGAWRVGDEVSMARVLGEELWDGLLPQARALLLAAEAHWRWSEREGGRMWAAVGTAYRNAIETEWRFRIGKEIAEVTGIPVERLTLGEMLRWVRKDCSVMRQAAMRALLTEESELFDAGFLMEATGVTGRWLNPDAHGGLDRNDTEALRRTMLDSALLGRFLRAVQPRHWRNARS